MWIKYLIIFILFYILAILQNTFFVHFSLLGSIPNLVFAFFVVLTFFEQKSNHYQIIFYAISAGLFLDFFSYTYFGVSVVLLLFTGFFIKKAQSLLQEKRGNKFPLSYFLPLFLVSIIVYDLFLKVFLNKFGLNQVFLIFSWSYLAEIVYNLLFAFIIFSFYKKFFQTNADNRQLKLFSK